MLAPMWHVNRDNAGRIDGITKCDDAIKAESEWRKLT